MSFVLFVVKFLSRFTNPLPKLGLGFSRNRAGLHNRWFESVAERIGDRLCPLTVIGGLRKVRSVIVGLDIDGVVADFLAPFLLLLEKRLGNGPISEESITDFKFKDHPLISEEVVHDCMQTVSYDPHFWQNLSSMISPSDWQNLENLSRRRQLVFVTHRYVRETYDIHGITCDWLKSHGISEPVVHFTNELKAELVQNLGVHLFMDDRHENCQDVAENTEAVVLMPRRPYNESFSHPRVKKIRDFSELFAHLS